MFVTDQRFSLLRPISKEELRERFPVVFAEKTGILAGQHHNRINEHVRPVQHAPRRMPVATRRKVQLKLDELERDGMVQKVTVPTQWISSMATVVKPNINGKIRICLDPKDLNEAVLRKLSTANYRRCGLSPPWCQSVHKSGCKKWFLACAVGRGIVIAHHLPLTFWPILLEKTAIWHLFRSRGVSAMDARDC